MEYSELRDKVERFKTQVTKRSSTIFTLSDKSRVKRIKLNEAQEVVFECKKEIDEMQKQIKFCTEKNGEDIIKINQWSKQIKVFEQLLDFGISKVYSFSLKLFSQIFKLIII